MHTAKVESSLFHTADYHPEKRVLTLHMTHGRAYDYHNVSPETHQAFLDAPSKGAFYNGHIKHKHPCSPK